MEKIGRQAKIASEDLFKLSISKRNAVLKQFSIYLKKNSKLILKANQKDILNAKKNKNNVIRDLLLMKKKFMKLH